MLRILRTIGLSINMSITLVSLAVAEEKSTSSISTTVQQIIKTSDLVKPQGRRDLEGLIQGKKCKAYPYHTSKEADVPSPQKPHTPILIFVSLSLPEASLKDYSRDVQKVKGRLLLQGLYKNSFKATQDKIKKLGITVDIDPPLFEKYVVKDVPTFIYTDPHAETINYDKVQGHITLVHALKLFDEKGTVQGVKVYLEKLRKKI